MAHFNALELIPSVELIREDVLAGMDACKTGFARGLYQTLAGQLGDVLAALAEEATREAELVEAKGTPDGDLLYRLYHICTSFEHEWVQPGPVSLVDEIHVGVSAGGETCQVHLDHTIVPNEELEGLGDVLAEIAKLTRIRFVVARV